LPCRYFTPFIFAVVACFRIAFIDGFAAFFDTCFRYFRLPRRASISPLRAMLTPFFARCAAAILFRLFSLIALTFSMFTPPADAAAAVRCRFGFSPIQLSTLSPAAARFLVAFRISFRYQSRQRAASRVFASYALQCTIAATTPLLFDSRPPLRLLPPPPCIAALPAFAIAVPTSPLMLPPWIWP